jgi:DNA-binding CsgD family transcriptional regulator
MSKSQLLRVGDCRRIQALLGECLDLGGDPYCWRDHLLTGLCQLAGAQLGMGGDARLIGPQRTFLAGPPILVGWSPAQQRIYFQNTRENSLANDEVLRGFTRPGQERVVTRSVEEVIERRPWHHSRQFQELMRPVGMDCNLVSFFPLDADGRIATLSLFRPLGDRWFNRRELGIVHRIQEELEVLIGTVLPTLEAPGPATLSPRLRQTLQCLLDGENEQQTAARLGIRPLSVHDYVKQLHRHFGVASRGELLAVFLRRTGVTAGLNHGERTPPDLPPRLRQSLQCLLEGDSEKQIARKLGISRETAHKNVAALYRRFGVSSRGALLASMLKLAP